MSYIMINGDTTHYNATEVVPFTTQHGFEAIRIVGNEIPETNQGFKFYDDNGKLISDLSSYTNLYRQNEYSVQKDIIVPPKGTDAPIPPSPFDQLNTKVNRINSQVINLTPYTDSKRCGIDETECEFDYRPGNITTWLQMGDNTISADYKVEDNKIIVMFEPLTEVAIVNISII